jgi:NAD(P)-dependent dehydrogenase (short-subunit alcohol dehydrogenase family)
MDSQRNGRLTGRRILITGGASGIGMATCRLFVREGAAVAILDRDREGLARVAEAAPALPVVADVADADAVAAAVDAAAAGLGGLDGVVNCAGISISRPFAQTDLAAWRLSLDVNLTGTYLVCHRALPHLRAATSATIVNISSASALQPLANRSAYAASKSAVIAFTKVLAMELAPSIRCNVVCPGGVDTPMVRAAFTSPEQIARIKSLYALGRMATPEEIADSILFLTGPESTFVTGITLAPDGGRSYH